jgi:hypothetical protein
VRDRAVTVARSPVDPTLARNNIRPGGFPPSRRADPATPPLVARLAALEGEIAVLRDRVAGLERQTGLRVDDDRALMRALVGSVGACVFTAAELLQHATIDRALQTALRRYRTAKHVGKALRRIADQPIAGFVLRRVTRDHTGTIWGVQVAGDLHAGSWPGEDSGA